jgi:hypothetical protein
MGVHGGGCPLASNRDHGPRAGRQSGRRGEKSVIHVMACPIFCFAFSASFSTLSSGVPMGWLYEVLARQPNVILLGRGPDFPA